MRTVIATIILFLFTSMAMAQEGLTLQEQKKLNTFFSNFSEAYVTSFTQESLTSDQLLYFGLMHAFINFQDKPMETEDGESVYIPSELIDKITKKNFNKTVSEHVLKNYLFPIASGEAFVFSQIKTINHLGDDVYSASGNIYSASSGSDIDPQGSPEDWLKAGEEVLVTGKFEATYKKTGNGFILLSYDVKAVSTEQCPYAEESTNMVIGEYQGVFDKDGVCYASVVSESGDFVDFRCANVEQALGSAAGKQVAVIFKIAQFWNDAKKSCDSGAFFAWGNELK